MCRASGQMKTTSPSKTKCGHAATNSRRPSPRRKKGLTRREWKAIVSDEDNLGGWNRHVGKASVEQIQPGVDIGSAPLFSGATGRVPKCGARGNGGRF